MSKKERPPMKRQALDSRVGRLEGVVETLSNEVQDTTKAVRVMAESFGNFKEDVLEKIGTATAPKWPLIASLTTMMLTVFGLCGTVVAILLSGQGELIHQNRLAIEQVHEKAIETSFNAGVMFAWKESTDKRLEHGERDLQLHIEDKKRDNK